MLRLVIRDAVNAPLRLGDLPLVCPRCSELHGAEALDVVVVGILVGLRDRHLVRRERRRVRALRRDRELEAVVRIPIAADQHLLHLHLAGSARAVRVLEFRRREVSRLLAVRVDILHHQVLGAVIGHGDLDSLLVGVVGDAVLYLLAFLRLGILRDDFLDLIGKGLAGLAVQVLQLVGDGRERRLLSLLHSGTGLNQPALSIQQLEGEGPVTQGRVSSLLRAQGRGAGSVVFVDEFNVAKAIDLIGIGQIRIRVLGQLFIGHAAVAQLVVVAGIGIAAGILGNHILDDIAGGIGGDIRRTGDGLLAEQEVMGATGALAEGDLREVDLGSVVLYAGIIRPASVLELLHGEVELLLFARRSLGAGACNLHILLGAKLCFGALVPSLMAEEVPLGANLVERMSGRDPASARAAVFHHITFRRKEYARWSAGDLQRAGLIGVENDMIQYVVFYPCLIAAVSARIAINLTQELAILVVYLQDILRNDHMAPRDVVHDRLSGQLLGHPTGRGKAEVRAVHVDRNVVREHGRVDDIPGRLYHRLRRIGRRRRLQLADQAIDIAADLLCSPRKDGDIKITGGVIVVDIFVIHRTVRIDILIVDVDIRIGGVGAGKVNPRTQLVHVERDIAAAAGIDVNAGCSHFIVGVDRKVGLCVVMPNVSIGNHAILSALAQHVVGVDRRVVIDLFDVHEVGDDRAVVLIFNHHVYAVNIANIVGHRIVARAGRQLDRVAVPNLFVILLDIDLEGLVAGDPVVRIGGRIVPLPDDVTAGLVFDLEGVDRLAVLFGFNTVCGDLVIVIEVYGRGLVRRMDTQLNVVRGNHAAAVLHDNLNLIDLAVRAVERNVGLRFSDVVPRLVRRIYVLPEIIPGYGVLALSVDIRKCFGQIAGCDRLVQSHVAGIDGGVVVQGSACNICALIVHQLEGVVHTDRRRKHAAVIGIDGIGHRHDPIPDQLAIVEQADAEEICTSRLVEFSIRDLRSLAHVIGSLCIEGNGDIVIHAVVLAPGEGGRHNAFTNRGGRREQILRQVAALGAANGIFVVEYRAGHVVLDQFGRQAIRAGNHLGGNGFGSGIIVRYSTDAAGARRLCVLIEDHGIRQPRRVAAGIHLVQRIVGVAVPDHLDQQLVVRGQGGRILDQRIIGIAELGHHLEVGYGRQGDGTHAILTLRGDLVLVGDVTIAKGLALLILIRSIAIDNRAIIGSII